MRLRNNRFFQIHFGLSRLGWTRWFAVHALILFCALSATGQHPSNDVPIRADVDLVQLAVSVTDPYGRLVVGLERENFRLYEDKVEQEISHFMQWDTPVSIGIVVDLSGSMADRVQYVHQAMQQFVRVANPQDEYCLVTVSDRAVLSSPFTRHSDRMLTRLLYREADGRTALLDGIYLAFAELRRSIHERRALLVISDGGDNHSRYNERDVRDVSREADVQVYTIGIFDPVNHRGTTEEMYGPEMLNSLAENAGGRSFYIKDMRDLTDIATKISLTLRNQYLIGYRSSNRAPDGKWRKLKIKLSPPRGLPPLRAYSRSGYYAPET